MISGAWRSKVSVVRLRYIWKSPACIWTLSLFAGLLWCCDPRHKHVATAALWRLRRLKHWIEQSIKIFLFLVTRCYPYFWRFYRIFWILTEIEPRSKLALAGLRAALTFYPPNNHMFLVSIKIRLELIIKDKGHIYIILCDFLCLLHINWSFRTFKYRMESFGWVYRKPSLWGDEMYFIVKYYSLVA